MTEIGDVAKKIAVVGSGPSGSYLIQSLRKKLPDAELVVFDRLPVPYGLIRYGVAPDHQGTKGVTEQFDRLFEREGVTFVGNIDVGNDVSLEELQRAFDVVVLATGVGTDRELGIAGEESARLYRAGRVTRLFNGYPDECRDGFELGSRVVIIGNGNVALDIVRLLCKTEQDFAGSDIDDPFHQRAVHALREINVVGRRAVADVRFDKTLLRELGRISEVTFRVHAAGGLREEVEPTRQSKVEEMLELETVGSLDSSRINVNFHFGWTPESLNDGPEEVSVVFHASDESGEKLTIAADSVITAVGFVAGGRDRWNREELLSAGADVSRDKLADGLYCTGWFGKGAQGTIPEHRSESKTLASTIADELTRLPHAAEKAGLAALTERVRDHVVDFQGWQRIDAIEREKATPGRFRQKLTTTEELLNAARGPVRTPTEGKRT